MSEAGPLKLLARDDQDIAVIAAVVQDAIAPVCDMLYRAEDKNFVLVVHRFRWDCAPEEPTEDCVYERVTCALDIEGVEAVQFQGFDPDQAGTMLDLLTMMVDAEGLHILFAGGARLRLKLGDWRLRLQDFGESWPTTHRPRHAT